MRRPERIDIRTDPAVIREVLAHAGQHGRAPTARTFGVHYRTVVRWQTKREQLGDPAWPTLEDVDAWREHQRREGELLARRAAHSRDYRKRVYLNRGPVQVDSTGSIRRLRALNALGHSQADIAAHLGVTSARVGHLMSGKWLRLWPSTADGIRKVYDELSMTVPQDPTPTRRGEIRSHDRTRRRARNLGYAPPLAWDDESIDNPDAEPYKPVEAPARDRYDEVVILRMLDGERIQSTTQEKAEVCRRWVRAGGTLRDLERRVGWKAERYYRISDDRAMAS